MAFKSFTMDGNRDILQALDAFIRKYYKNLLLRIKKIREKYESGKQ